MSIFLEFQVTYYKNPRSTPDFSNMTSQKRRVVGKLE
jgi:hypothetical protein